MFYKKIIILSIFYFCILNKMNIVISFYYDNSINNVNNITINNTNNNTNNNNNSYNKKAIARLIYNDKILSDIPNNKIVIKYNVYKDNNLLDFVYNKKSSKVEYKPMLISILKDGFSYGFLREENVYFYCVHKKKFLIPYYIYDFVYINNISRDKKWIL